jgi:hypothetical protein
VAAKEVGMSEKIGKTAARHKAVHLPHLPEDPNADYCRRLAEEAVKAAEAGHQGQLQGGVSRLRGASAAELEQKLRADARLQWDAAIETGYTPSKWLLEQELKARRRWDRATEDFVEEPCLRHDGKEARDVYEIAAEQELTGVCFSGGGIRSATFNLGVMQGLAQLGLLRFLDYLSSVSGGGYIHQFLAAWILRDQEGSLGVERKLIPRPEPGCPDQAPEPIKWLRRYASYLTPQRGILSTDTWTLIAIWFRNTVLNQVPIVAFLAAVFFLLNLLVPEDVKVPFKFTTPESVLWPFVLVSGVVIAVFAVRSIVLLGGDLHRQAKISSRDRVPEAGSHAAVEANDAGPHSAAPTGKAARSEARLYEKLLSNGNVQVSIIAPWLAMSVWITYWRGLPWHLPQWAAITGWAVYVAALALIAMLVAFAGGGLQAFKGLHAGSDERAWLAGLGFAAGCVVAAAVACAMGYGFQQDCASLTAWIGGEFAKPGWLNFGTQVDPWRFQVVILPSLLLTVPYIAIETTLGLLGRDYSDTRREWLARLRAWSMLYCVVWMGLTAIALLGPYLMYFVASKSAVVRASAAATFVVSHLATLLAGASSKSDGKPTSKGFLGYKPMDLVAMAAAPVAVTTFLLMVGFGVERVIELLTQTWPTVHCVFLLSGCAVVSALLAALFGWRLDINDFSMQSFYRNRLSRCYLGASIWQRKPNPFTGFDMRSRIEMTNPRARNSPPLVSDLVPDNFNQLGLPEGEYGGPFPIFCATLNLTTGEDLASQERKGTSFSFTPLYSGYSVDWTDARKDEKVSLNGYVPTARYAYRDRGIHLDTAVAISGAAVNPNQGYNSNPALAFLMTFFNVRLGWWISNPRNTGVWEAEKNRATPRFALKYLLRELFGSANDKSKYVNLSDGGHFENMGLYELVRRRCKFIIVCDAEEDPDMKFCGIGNAVNRCRADFGAEIDLDLRPLQIQEDGFSKTHCVVGTILYPPPQQEAATGAAKPRMSECEGDKKTDPCQGIILYMKSSLVGDEPPDLLAYRLQHDTFPQDSTGNQWFTETQFESYRRLGYHIAMTAIRPALRPPQKKDLDKVTARTQVAELFANLYSIWYPRTPEMEKYLSQHVQQYNALLSELRQRPELAGLAERLFDERNSPGGQLPSDAPEVPAQSNSYAWQFANALLDFMYVIYTDLELAFPDNRTSPHADWWLCLFRRWCRVSLLQETWRRLEPVYPEEFRLFALRELNLRDRTRETAEPAS